jgi:hypothetical protein
MAVDAGLPKFPGQVGDVGGFCRKKVFSTSSSGLPSARRCTHSLFGRAGSDERGPAGEIKIHRLLPLKAATSEKGVPCRQEDE